ncbi:MAG: hypothetical protein AVDCRST_MAG30-2878, partial [uncultured Solirubrobacteraceae bacterium]
GCPLPHPRPAAPARRVATRPRQGAVGLPQPGPQRVRHGGRARHRDHLAAHRGEPQGRGGRGALTRGAHRAARGRRAGPRRARVARPRHGGRQGRRGVRLRRRRRARGGLARAPDRLLRDRQRLAVRRAARHAGRGRAVVHPARQPPQRPLPGR